MKIILENDDDRVLIDSICDVALKGGGLKNLEGVQIIRQSIVDNSKKKPEDEKRESEG